MSYTVKELLETQNDNSVLHVVMRHGGQDTRIHFGGAKEIADKVNGKHIRSYTSNKGKGNDVHVISLNDQGANLMNAADKLEKEKDINTVIIARQQQEL